MLTFFLGLGSNEFHIKWRFGTHGTWKNKNPGGRFGASSSTALPIHPILPDFLVNGPNWQCCWAGSFKMASRIWIVFNCPGCQILILWEIHCYLCPMPPKSWHNNSFLGSVAYVCHFVNATQNWLGRIQKFLCISFLFKMVENMRKNSFFHVICTFWKKIQHFVFFRWKCKIIKFIKIQIISKVKRYRFVMKCYQDRR